MLVCSLALFCASVCLTVTGSNSNNERNKVLPANKGEQKTPNIKGKTPHAQPLGVINIPEPKDGAPIGIIIYSLLQPTEDGVYNRRAEFIKRKIPPS